MPATRNVLAFVMAGGEGSRLHPLTANRCKPAVPWNQAGPWRICGGTTVMKCCGMKRAMVQDWRTCSISDCDLYCTSR